MFTSFSGKKDLPLSGCNIWLAPDLSSSKSEFKHIVEGNGGKLCTRLSGKVNFAVTKKQSGELDDKVSKYSITIIQESFLRDCIKSSTPLFPFTNPHHNELQKENFPNYLSSPPLNAPGSPSTSAPNTAAATNQSSVPTPSCPAPFNVYDFEPAGSPPPSRPRGIRERLKSLSLKTKSKTKLKGSTNPAALSPSYSTSQLVSSNHQPSPSKTISKSPSTSAHRSRMRNAVRALSESHLHSSQNIPSPSQSLPTPTPPTPAQIQMPPSQLVVAGVAGEAEKVVVENHPLNSLVFVIYGTFSMPRNVVEDLIVANGGKFVPSVGEEVTHLLFGGEDIDAGEYALATKLKVNIVNEYFLRLLIKY